MNEARGRLTGIKRCRRWHILRTAFLLLSVTGSMNAQRPSEYQVKAAFLFNFTKFVEWPAKAFPDSSAPLIIGIIGDDPFGDALPQMIQGETARGRQIKIQRFKENEDWRGCHVLFLSRSAADQTDRILQQLQRLSVLTVGETEDFARQGGMIGFTIVDKSIRFDVNLRAIEVTELKVSSRLLAVARAVLRAS